MEKKYNSFLTNTLFFAIGNFMSKIMLFLLLPVYTRCLTTTEYGIAELLITFSQTCVSISSLCIAEATFRFGMEENHNDVLKNSLFVTVFSIILIVGIQFGLVLYNPLAPYRLYFSMIAILEMLRGIFSTYTQSQKKVKLFSIDNVLYTFVLCITNIVLLVVLRMNIHGYFIAYIIANGFSILFLIVTGQYYNQILSSRFNRELLVKMITYSSPLIINSIAWSVNGLLDKTMLVAYRSAADVGLYTAASKIPSILSFVTAVVTQAWTISSIQEYQGDKDEGFYSNIFTSLHIAIALLALAVFILNNNLLVLFLGESFRASSKYVPVLIVGAVFWAYANFFTAIFQTTLKSKYIMISTVIGAAVNAVINVLLIPKFGVFGACIATGLAYMFISIYRMRKGLSLISFNIDMVKYIITVALLFFSALATTFNQYNILISVTSVVIIIIMYLGYLKSIVKGIAKYTRIRIRGISQ